MEAFIVTLLQGIPEMTGAIALCLALSRTRVNWGISLAMGALLAVVMFVFRTYAPFGLHTIVGVILIVVFLTSLQHVPVIRALLATFASMVILLLVETAINAVWVALLHSDPYVTLSHSSLLWGLLGIPQAVILMVLALIAPKIVGIRG
jgi:hypothetical protein